jgi:hypothetical protein
VGQGLAQPRGSGRGVARVQRFFGAGQRFGWGNT